MTDREKWEKMKELEGMISDWLDIPETQKKIDESLDKAQAMKQRFERSNFIESELLREPVA